MAYNRIIKQSVVSKYDMYKVPYDASKMYEVFQKAYEHEAKKHGFVDSPYEIFKNRHLCHGAVQSASVEVVGRLLWDLLASENCCSKNDGMKKTAFGTYQNYEIRGITKYTYWGPATSTGSSREPTKKWTLEKLNQHQKDIWDKINSVYGYIVCLLDFPPFLYFFFIPSQSVIGLYNAGSLMYNGEDERRKGHIINKVSISQIFRFCFSSNTVEPNLFEWQEKDIFDVGKDKIEYNKSLFSSTFSNTKMKKSAKRMKDNGVNIIHELNPRILYGDGSH